MNCGFDATCRLNEVDKGGITLWGEEKIASFSAFSRHPV